MNHQPTENIEALLSQLQSKSFQQRGKAAAALAKLNISADDYPAVPQPRFAEFEQAVRHALSRATDVDANKQIIKQATALSSLAPGFLPLLICLVAQLLGVFRSSPPAGAVLLSAATLFLIFWYFKCLNKGLREIVEPGRRASQIGREIGLFKSG